jgi:hypothetical protein
MGDTAFSKLAKTISICHRTPQADRVKTLFYSSAVLMMNFPRGTAGWLLLFGRDCGVLQR